MEKPFCLFNLNVCMFVFSGVKFRIFYSLLWMYWWWSGSRLWRICPCHTWNLFTVSIYFTLTNMGAIGCQLYCFLGIDRLKMKEKMYIQNFYWWKVQNLFLYFHLHVTWLYGSWYHQKNLEKKAFWKYDSWFSSEVSKITSVGNKTNLSLIYWFLEAKYIFWISYGPKE